MKIAMDWLASYLDQPIEAKEAEQALTDAGLPLESIEPFDATQVLDVEVTSNRSDCLSYLGMARELATLLGRALRPPAEPSLAEADSAAPAITQVEIADPEACSYYSARVIERVKVGPSPAWLARRLESVGLRPVNNIVDITNYVLMETGQPLHAFDFDRLEQQRIIVRRAASGEKIVAIDGKTYDLKPSMLVIADARRPVAIAGVMGGQETEVTRQTTRVLLESARFDPVTIRAQARALSLMSDSSFRFERGIDPTAAERASRRAAQMMVELAGGRVAPGVVRAGSAAPPQVQVSLRLSRLPQVLGYEIPTPRVMEILQALGLAPERSNDRVSCTVPPHRLDISREIDLVEEVARVYGYAHIPLRNAVSHSVQPRPPEEKARAITLRALQAAGFNETISVTFVDESEARLFLPADRGTAVQVSDAVRKASNVLRPSLLPSLLAVRRTNQNAGLPDARLFEHAEGFWQEGLAAERPPTQHRFLALVGNTLSEVKGALELIAQQLHPRARVLATPAEFAWYAPGAAATLVLDLDGRQNELGSFGLFSDAVQKKYDLRHPAAGAEVYLAALLASFEPVRTATALPRFPSVRRDLTVVLDEPIRWSSVAEAVSQAKLAQLESVEFVGTFRNKQLGPGRKSLTLALEFRDPTTTLRSEQVDHQMQQALQALQERCGATLRQ